MITRVDMGEPTNLANVRTKDGDNLVHQLVKGKLKDAHRLPNLSPEEKAALKAITKDRECSTGPGALARLTYHKCEVHTLNRSGLTPFDIVWSRLRSIFKLVKKKSKKLIYLNAEDLELLNALFVCGSGPTKKGIGEFAELSVEIVSHNRLESRNYVPDPHQVSEWMPASAILSKEGNCHPQTELIQYLISEMLAKSRHRDIIAAILTIKSCCLEAHPDVSDEGLLLEFFKALKVVFDSSMSLHRWFLMRGVSRELIPIVDVLCGNDQCSSINEQDNGTGHSPLYLAANFGMYKIVRLLLDHPNVNVNITGAMTPSPLMAALVKIKMQEIWASEIFGHYLHTCRMLAERDDQDLSVADRVKTNPLATCVKVLGNLGCRYREKHQYYSLHQNKKDKLKVPIQKDQSIAMFCVKASLEDELEDLMKDHYDLDMWWTDSLGKNILHAAGQLGLHRTVKLLMQKEGDLGLCNMPDNNGNTPLFYILKFVSAQYLLELLMGYKSHWDFQHKNHHNEMPVVYYDKAVRTKNRDKQILELLKDLTDKPPEQTIQRRGLLRGSKQATYHRGADINGKATVEVERFVGQLFDMELVFKRLVALSDRDTINALDNEKKTPLMCCAELGLLSEMEYLLKESINIDVNKQGQNDYTALHLAAIAHQEECALCLLQHEGIDVNIQDREGNTGLFYMMVHFTTIEAIRVLRDKPWDFLLKNSVHQTAYCFYKQKADQMDPGLEDALRRRCLPELTTPAPQSPMWGPFANRRFSVLQERHRLDSLNGAAVKHVWEIVQKNRVFFVSNFVDSDLFFDYLIQEQVIDPNTVKLRFRKNHHTDQQVAEELLAFLPRRGNVFSKFLEALDLSNQSHISNKMRRETHAILPQPPVTMQPPITMHQRSVEEHSYASSISPGSSLPLGTQPPSTSQDQHLANMMRPMSVSSSCSTIQSVSSDTMPKQPDPYGFPTIEQVDDGDSPPRSSTSSDASAGSTS